MPGVAFCHSLCGGRGERVRSQDSQSVGQDGREMSALTGEVVMMIHM